MDDKRVETRTSQEAELLASNDQTLRLLARYLGRVRAKYPAHKVEAVKSPKYADNDYMIFIDGKLHHFVEIKTRRNEMGRYERTKLPLRKHAVAQHYWEALRVKTYFIAGFTCGTVGVLDLTQEPDEVSTMVARYDRGEDTDVYAFYDITRFTKI